MWFDDEYRLEQKQNIQVCFSKGEITILDEFHIFYSKNQINLPESKGTVETWPENPSWLKIIKKAKKTLNKLSTNKK